MTDETKPYGFAKSFERVVATMLVRSREFYARMGGEVDANAIVDKNAAWVIRAAQAIAEETSQGPGNMIIVAQRLRRWCDEGKITIAMSAECVDMMFDAIDEGMPELESVVNELAPIVRRRVEKSIIEDGIRLFSAREDLSEIAVKIQAASRIGLAETVLGEKFGVGVAEGIAKLRMIKKMPTGIIELDQLTGGGLPIGQVQSLLAVTGAGKSQQLNSQTAYGILKGAAVAFASLELPKEMQQARLWAALTNVPVDDILSGVGDKLARERLAAIETNGCCYHADFEPGASLEDILQWVDSMEQSSGRKIDMLVLDYADKLHGGMENQYVQMRKVYDDMLKYAQGKLAIAHGLLRWIFTATQANRKKQGIAILGTEHAADSNHKGNSVDQMISINPDDLFENVKLHVCKNRTGPSRGVTPEICTEFAYGRLCSVVYPGQRRPKRIHPDEPEVEQTQFDHLFGDGKGRLH